MPGCRIIHHCGKQIHHFDYRGAGADEVLELFDHANTILLEHADEAELYFIADYTGVPITKAGIVKLHGAKARRANKAVTRAAILGVQGLGQTILNTFNAIMDKEYRAVDDMPAALAHICES